MAMQPDISRLCIDDGLDGAAFVAAPPTSSTPDKPKQPWQYSGSIRAKDITKEFTDACAELPQGQLVKDEYFTLFESVGALEIMDPKMDSGFMLPEKDALVDNFDPLNPLLPEEIIGIMDQMLCYEMAWYGGYPLSQTLFTSLHLNALTPQGYCPLERVVFSARVAKPLGASDPLISDVLRAYCIGTLKCCDSVIAEVISEHYYEEEDFITQTFTQYLLSDIDDDAILAVIEAARSTLINGIDVASDVKTAFAARLEFRSLLLRALKPLDASTSFAEKTQLWRDVLGALEKVDGTTALGKEVPDAFSERVQRHLASNTPPRPMISITWNEAFPKLRRLCEDNIEALRLATIDCEPEVNPSPANIIRFVNDFSSRDPKPSTYSRALLQGILFKSSAFALRTSHQHLLMCDIKELSLAGDPLVSPENWNVELPSDPRHQIAHRIDDFTAKALEEYLNISRMLAQNRSRARRTLNQSIAVLDSLQAEAEMADESIHAVIAYTASSPYFPASSPARTFIASLEPLQYFPLAAWAYFHKLLIGEWSVLLGFETEVFLAEETASMYAFLSFLAQTREEHLGHVEMFAQRRMMRLAKAGQRQGVKEVISNRAFIGVLLAQAKVTRWMADGLRGLFALLTTLRLISTPRHSYGSPELRHQLRMKPFLPLGTPVLPTASHLTAQTTLSPSTAIATVCDDIMAAVAKAKEQVRVLLKTNAETGRYKGCEAAWEVEWKGMLDSAVGVEAAVSAIREWCAKAGTVNVGDAAVPAADGSGGKSRRDEEEKIRIEIPEPRRRARVGWAVPKIVT